LLCPLGDIGGHRRAKSAAFRHAVSYTLGG
jgi:hypothetical protein